MRVKRPHLHNKERTCRGKKKARRSKGKKPFSPSLRSTHAGNAQRQAHPRFFPFDLSFFLCFSFAPALAVWPLQDPFKLCHYFHPLCSPSLLFPPSTLTPDPIRPRGRGWRNGPESASVPAVQSKRVCSRRCEGVRYAKDVSSGKWSLGTSAGTLESRACSFSLFLFRPRYELVGGWPHPSARCAPAPCCVFS